MIERYWKRCQFDWQKTARRIQEYMEWRRSVGLDEQLDKYAKHGISDSTFARISSSQRLLDVSNSSRCEDLSSPDLHYYSQYRCLSSGFFYMLPESNSVCKDSRGRPLAIMHLSKMDLALFDNRKALYAFFHFVFETMRLELCRSSPYFTRSQQQYPSSNMPVYQCALLFDASGAGFGHLDVELGKYLFGIMHNYYPDMIGSAYVFNLPWLLNSSWSIVSSLLSAEARQRVNFVSCASEIDCLAGVSTRLPVEFTGSNSSSDCFVYDFKQYVEDYLPCLVDNSALKDSDPQPIPTVSVEEEEKEEFYDALSSIPSTGSIIQPSDHHIQRPITTRNQYDIVELNIQRRNYMMPLSIKLPAIFTADESKTSTTEGSTSESGENMWLVRYCIIWWKRLSILRKFSISALILAATLLLIRNSRIRDRTRRLLKR